MTRKLLAASVLIIIVASIVVGCTFVTTNTTSATAASLTPASTAKTPQITPNSASDAGPFIGSKNSDVYHYPWCTYVSRIKPENQVTFPTAAAAQAAGYHPCSVCHPPS